MIDTHSHLLFGVDDGPDTIEESIEMLNDAARQGISHIVLTPHYRKGMFSYDKEKIIKRAKVLRAYCKRAEIPVKLHLGCEYHVDDMILENITSGRARTMAGGDYILMEFSYASEYEEILEQVRKVLLSEYHPIIAHAERCSCLEKNPKLCIELKEEGALIQCNADSVLGYGTKQMKKAVHKMLKMHIVDIIASDCHGIAERPNRMSEAEHLIKRKYGRDYAEELFVKNPAQVIRRKK